MITHSGVATKLSQYYGSEIDGPSYSIGEFYYTCEVHRIVTLDSGKNIYIPHTMRFNIVIGKKYCFLYEGDKSTDILLGIAEMD